MICYFKGFSSEAQMLQYKKETKSTIFVFKDIQCSFICALSL